MYEPFLRKKPWNSGLDEDTLKKVVTIFIDILVKKKDLVQFSKHCFELPCQSETQKC